MTDLLDAVDELTLPVTIHLPQIADDGKWLRAHTTVLPSLLSQLEQAIASSTSGRAGGGNPAARSVLNSAALYEFSKIASQVGDWCRIEKVATTRDVSRDLRAWYVSRLSRNQDSGFYVTQLWKWAGIIRAQLDPPVVIPQDATCPIPECAATQWVNDDGETMPFPIIVQYQASDLDVLRNARATCRSCGHLWEGEWALRVLRSELDEREKSMSNQTEAEGRARSAYQMNPLSAEYVASFDINPNRMPLNGWDATGYTAYAGEGPFGESSKPERNPWPEGFDYAELLDRWAADAPTRRGLR